MGGSKQLPRSFWVALSSLLAFAVVAPLGSRTFVADSLMGLYLGRFIRESGLPRVDTLTIEGADRPWIDQQWLAQLAYHGTWDIAGYAGAALLSAGAITMAFGILAHVLLTRGIPGMQAVAWTGVALVVALNNTFIRAQSFALPLFMIVVALLLADARRTRFSFAIWTSLLATLVVWANIHGSLLLTIPPVVGWAAWRAFRSRRDGVRAWSGWAVAGLLAPLTIFATPYGTGMLTYYRSVMTNDTIAFFISEWEPANFGAPHSAPFLLFLGFSIVAISYRWGAGHRPPLLPFLLVLWYGLIGTQALRYHIWVAFPGAILLADILRMRTIEDAERTRRARRLLTPVLATLVVLAGIIVVSFATRSDDAWLGTIPLEEVDAAAAWLERHPDARIIADDPSAPALLWRHPDTVEGRIAFDARLEHFAERDFRRLVFLLEALGPEWLDATKGYDAVVVSRLYHERAAGLLEEQEDWRVESSSDEGVFVVREKR